MIFLKEFFKKVNYEIISRQQKGHAKLPSRQRVKPQLCRCYVFLPSTAIFVVVFSRHIPCCSRAFWASLETSSTVPLASISKQAGSSILLYESHNLKINYGYVLKVCPDSITFCLLGNFSCSCCRMLIFTT